jgi:pimeloyl-ACP methyl ester carboxylesterase
MDSTRPPSHPGIERRRVQVDRTSVHYVVAGAGKPVILVHGLAGSARWWTPTIPSLAERFRVYAVDLVGFGATTSQHSFTLGDAATFLTRWMDRVGIDRASVVGYSMGGFIAADLAANFPNRVDRLVLVDATLFPSGFGVLRPTVGLARTILGLPTRLLLTLLADSVRAGPVAILAAASQLLTTDIWSKLSQIHAPTLVIWGDDDAIVPVSMGRQLSQRIPKAEFVVLHGTDHNPMWRCPDEFNRLVADFLAAPVASEKG